MRTNLDLPSCRRATIGFDRAFDLLKTHGRREPAATACGRSWRRMSLATSSILMPMRSDRSIMRRFRPDPD